MLHNFIRPGAEAPSGAERAGQGTNDHIHLGWVHVLMLRHSAPVTTQNRKRPGFVQNQSEFVTELEFNLSRLHEQLNGDPALMVAYDSGKIHHVPDIFEQSFGDNESPGQRLLGLLFRDLFQHSFHVLQIVMLIPSNGASRYLNAFADGEIDRFVRDDDVPTLGKCWDDAGDGRESLRVDNA